MKTDNFLHLIREITGEPFRIDEPGEEVLLDQLYFVRLSLAGSAHLLEFQWKTPKDEENLLRSFVTAYCSRCRVVNPAHYVSDNPRYDWKNMSQKDRDYARLCHHRGNMFSKEELMEQIETRFKGENMGKVLSRYGFYFTDYGIGIFVLFGGKAVDDACGSMREFLAGRGVGFTNEFSKAGWVLRFRLGLTREIHAGLLSEFSAASTST